MSNREQTSIIQKIRHRLVAGFEMVVQYLLITLEYFNKHGLANHAAAGAYGFLFSAAPALLIVSFFVFDVLKSSPETAVELIAQMGLLSQVFDMHQLAGTFLSVSKPGIAGFISVVGLLWTARIFAVSLQRGLGVIFPDTEKITPAKKMMVSVGIEAAIILFTFITVFSSAAAFLVYDVIGIIHFDNERLAGISSVLSWLVPLITAGFLVFSGYVFVPAKAPKKNAALIGTLFCLGSFAAIILASRFIFNSQKYNATYGTLGNLLLLLAVVYFFFILFFLGAELTVIIHSFDALLLSRFIQTNSDPKKNSIMKRWFTSTKGVLHKYVRFFEKDKVLFYKGDKSNEVYYILQGEASVYLDGSTMLTLIKQGKFFGEMESLLAGGGRSATIKAHSDLQVLMISPLLFQDVLKYSSDADHKVIKMLSERLRDVNEKLITDDQVSAENP